MKRPVQTFGPSIFHPNDTDEFEARCYATGFICAFLSGEECTYVRPRRKLENKPATPDWCEMKASMLWDAQAAARETER